MIIAKDEALHQKQYDAACHNVAGGLLITGVWMGLAGSEQPLQPPSPSVITSITEICTRAISETRSSVQVDKDIERVQAENRKRSQQWQANLQKLQKLEAKLKVCRLIWEPSNELQMTPRMT